MSGIGGTNMENQGINYRERSPLVVPPKLDLPPPAGTTADVKAPNWPKDPDEKARARSRAQPRKNENKDPREASRVDAERAAQKAQHPPAAIGRPAGAILERPTRS